MKKMILSWTLGLSLLASTLAPSQALAASYSDGPGFIGIMAVYAALFGLAKAPSQGEEIKFTKLQKEFYDLSQNPKSLDLLSQSAAGIKTAK